MDETITIAKNYYEELRKDQKILNALRRGGVDNWEWYYDSLKDAGLIEDEDA